MAPGTCERTNAQQAQRVELSLARAGMVVATAPSGLMVDALAALALLLPASVAMGATYPLLVALSATECGAMVRAPYVAGLAGIVAGTVLTALVWSPGFGLDWSALVASSLNFVLAGCALRWLTSDGPADVNPSSSDVTHIQKLLVAEQGPIARFAVAGLLGLAAQAVWNRARVPYAGVSVFTFASIVATYVLAQAIGFWIYSRRASAPRLWLSNAALAAAPATALATLGILAVVPDLPSRDGARVSGWLASV